MHFVSSLSTAQASARELYERLLCSALAYFFCFFFTSLSHFFRCFGVIASISSGVAVRLYAFFCAYSTIALASASAACFAASIRAASAAASSSAAIRAASASASSLARCSACRFK